MKRLFLILFCLIAGTSYGQYNYLIQEGGQELFVCVYEMPGKDAAEIEKLLAVNVPRMKNITKVDKSTGVITAKIEDAILDYAKYGCKWGNTSAFMNHPFYANVTVEWKDEKYRVTLSNLEFHARGVGVIRNPFSNGDATKFLQNKTATRSGECFEKYFADLFVINSNSSDW